MARREKKATDRKKKAVPACAAPVVAACLPAARPRSQAASVCAATSAGSPICLSREMPSNFTEQYQIAYIELDRNPELDEVCHIFTQINSRGIRLDVFDLINALLKPKGLQPKHLWREAPEESVRELAGRSFLGFGWVVFVFCVGANR